MGCTQLELTETLAKEFYLISNFAAMATKINYFFRPEFLFNRSGTDSFSALVEMYWLESGLPYFDFYLCLLLVYFVSTAGFCDLYAARLVSD